MKKFTIAQPGFELGTIGLLDGRAATELLLQKGSCKIFLFTSTFFKINRILLRFSTVFSWLQVRIQTKDLTKIALTPRISNYLFL